MVTCWFLWACGSRGIRFIRLGFRRGRGTTGIVADDRISESSGIALSRQVEPRVTVFFEFEEGPRNGESMAVDAARQEILLVSKSKNYPDEWQLADRRVRRALNMTFQISHITSLLNPFKFIPLRKDFTFYTTCIKLVNRGSSARACFGLLHQQEGNGTCGEKRSVSR